jgi:predicted nucleic acid-binding Zn ribbon protein
MLVEHQTVKVIRHLRNPDKWQRLWLIRKHMAIQAYDLWWRGHLSIDTCRMLDKKANRTLLMLGYRLESVTAAQPEEEEQGVTAAQPEEEEQGVTSGSSCLVCGASLEGKRRNSVTCSAKCRKTLSRSSTRKQKSLVFTEGEKSG